MSAAAEPFDSLGHDWEREYSDEGEPVLSMRCRRCGYRWFPIETIEQIGRCAREVSEVHDG